MARMNTKILLTSLSALGLLVAGCDIFPTQPGGTPTVVRLLAVDQLAYTTPPEATAANAGGTWVLGEPALANGVDASNVNSPGPGGHASAFQIIDVQLNKVINGDTVQTSATDCTPAAGAGAITVSTGAAQPSGAFCNDVWQSQVTVSCFAKWYACYVPQSSDPTVGSQILIFQTGSTKYDPTSTPAGQGAGLLPGYSYAVTGTVKDFAGADLAIKANVTTKTGPMITGTTTSSLTVSWNGTSDVTSVELQRAPDNAGAPGTFTAVAGAPTTGSGSFTDPGLTPGTPYWYQLVLNPGAVVSGLTQGTVLPVADAAVPTFTGVAAGTVTVNWTPSLAGVDTYRVQRAPDDTTTPGTPGTYATIKSKLTPATGTYTDATVKTGKTYWYRILSVAADGVENNATEASVAVP